MAALEACDPALFFPGTPDDPRLGAQVVQRPVDPESDGRVRVALIGIADDRGIANGGGRPGARLGPTELRRWLYKMTTGGEQELSRLCLYDLGDAVPGEGLPDDVRTVAEVHALAEEAVRAALAAGAAVVLLGGGHDGAFASQSGLLASLKEGERAAAINVDSHLDVRPLRDGKITSGTPFRRLHERWGDRFSLAEFGIQMQHNSAAHVAWARQRQWPVLELRTLRDEGPATLRFYRQLAALSAHADALAVSLDLDAVEAASAPGVSAPCPDGFSAADLCTFARIAGRHGKVRLLDVMECAPPLDVDGRTARLGATAIWNFLAGLCGAE